ncbi:hypothetical protein HN51_060533 [Arachis hypogaea]|uniref:Uncharacterized protein n=1 Tax=Arachis hypogaea TaxID=3818 RepID=A0A444XA11_ARAHY|nr:uncharacterized protein LOC107623900 [Arachis ipaensis]XP_025680888.1 uncharacterized protein LOC112782624 [Arachis hypogaea]QHO04849.1 uncharacterized protein DS421_13g443700 [Arachis hypogaea]RYQ86526.1 hypothetical protein Ahy_B10g106195 isoform A [Arachis hypogaea]
MEEDFDFGKKVSINDTMDAAEQNASNSTKILLLLRSFLGIQQRRAEAYSKLKRGFSDYMASGGELAYQKLCSEITIEFNDCSKKVLEMESLFQSPDYQRLDLAQILRAVQDQEKQKLHLTATIQVLKKAGRPSERLVSHENCKYTKPREHECVHVQEITEASGTEEAEADAEYDNALKEAIKGVQDAVTAINEHLEEVRYEIEALEAD